MKFGSFLGLVCVLLARQSTAQEVLEVTLTCEFTDYSINVFHDYACVLREIEFDFSSPFYYIVIEGEHQENRDNSHVRNLVIAESNIDQIPANIFQVFPNLEAILVEVSGVTAISVGNFVFANTLRALFLSGNNIPALTGSPFFGRGAMTHLSFVYNGIQTISPQYFNGLTGLQYLALTGNNIQTLANTQLAPLTNLRTFIASGNQLQRLSNNFFATNTQLQMIGLEFNAIDQIGSNLFNGLNNLIYIGLNGNVCFNGYFENEDAVDREAIDEALATCISNFIPDPPRDRALTFELRGTMTIFDEYRRELLNVEGREW